MIIGLVPCGKLEVVRKMFKKMPCKNVVSWTAMIDGYVKHKQPIKAFDLFERMWHDNVGPNEFTLVSLIRASTEMVSLKLGKWIHDYAFNNGFKLDPFLGTTLIHMYSKCGNLDGARRVFDMMKVRNLATWNTMITSFGVYGLSDEAQAPFEEMEKANEVHEAITFVGILSVCVHMNNLEKGEKYFNLMTQHYGIAPVMEHYTCMVKLYIRASKLDKTCTLENTMSVETNHHVVELLQETKLIGIDDIKELLDKHYRDLHCSKPVVDHFSSNCLPQLHSFKRDGG